MLEFAAAIVFLMGTPGPGVLSAAGVGSAYGARAGGAYVAGLFVGNYLVVGLVVSGIAALALALPWLRMLLLWGSVSYLLYLAAKIALAGSRIAFIHRESPPGFWNGVVFQPINPKAYAVNTALFSGFAFMPQAPATEVLVKALIMAAIWIPIHIAWLFLGVTLRRLDLSETANRAINFVMAFAMVAVVAIAITAQF
ncbi:LysE family translocator [Acuticoccus mangrovi]|uniref:LysE family transporter n=1 Tax=Acuticoccus mangrovi TaxID=2796142 RepID=A0A934ING2_9HYPH|nr:LysE family transporter [Acuticoccus mangrovi]MBJ3774624.1 LysE family transporter [Acuticoccus mangrovi]